MGYAIGFITNTILALIFGDGIIGTVALCLLVPSFIATLIALIRKTHDTKGIDLDKSKNIQIRTYIDDMARCLSAADLVICRAGASSLSEIQALGKPSILIPSTNVTENHQYHNAMALVNKNAAVIIEEKDLSGRALGNAIDNLLKDKNRFAQISKNARDMAVIDATSRICDIVLGLIKN